MTQCKAHYPIALPAIVMSCCVVTVLSTLNPAASSCSLSKASTRDQIGTGKIIAAPSVQD